MFELLKRWSELESNRCYIDTGHNWRLLAANPTCGWGMPLAESELWEQDFSVLLGAILNAIAAHPTLRYSLQNSESGTHSSLRDIDDSAIAFDSMDGEPAIALLTVYLQWLESRK